MSLMEQSSVSPHNTVLIITPTGFSFNLREVWRFRELLYFLVWRDLKVRYRQTVIGAAWAILQPALTALIFSVIFGYFVRIPTDQVPYPLFAYAALLPWNYAAQAVERSANSLIEHERLITKVYFPRLLVPLASVSTPIVDAALAFVMSSSNCCFLPAYRFLKRQIRWPGIPISFRIFHSFL